MEAEAIGSVMTLEALGAEVAGAYLQQFRVRIDQVEGRFWNVEIDLIAVVHAPVAEAMACVAAYEGHSTLRVRRGLKSKGRALEDNLFAVVEAHLSVRLIAEDDCHVRRVNVRPFPAFKCDGIFGPGWNVVRAGRDGQVALSGGVSLLELVCQALGMLWISDRRCWKPAA